MRGQFAGRLAGVHLDDQPDLFEVVGAARTPCGLAGTRQRRQQNRREDPYDSYHYKQFDQRKAFVFVKHQSGNLHNCSCVLLDSFSVDNTMGKIFAENKTRLHSPKAPSQTSSAISWAPSVSVMSASR